MGEGGLQFNLLSENWEKIKPSWFPLEWDWKKWFAMKKIRDNKFYMKLSLYIITLHCSFCRCDYIVLGNFGQPSPSYSRRYDEIYVSLS